MAILGFDVGGSSIKFSVMNEEGQILRKGSILTPDNLEDFYKELAAAKEGLAEAYQLEGAAFSLPGAVDDEAGVIGGAISEREDFVENINRHLHGILDKVGIARIRPQVTRAEFGNAANLIGAVYHFLQQKK